MCCCSDVTLFGLTADQVQAILIQLAGHFSHKWAATGMLDHQGISFALMGSNKSSAADAPCHQYCKADCGACRLYVIHRCKKLKQLDFRKVKQKEREEAAQVIGAAQQPADAAAQDKATTFEPDEDLAQAEAAAAAAQQQVSPTLWPFSHASAKGTLICHICGFTLYWMSTVSAPHLGHGRAR